MIIKCPKCNKLLEVPKEKLGKKEVCEHCEHIFVVDESVIYKETQTTPIPISTASSEIPKQAPSPPPISPITKKKPNIVLRIVLTAIITIIVIGVIAVIMESQQQGESSYTQTHVPTTVTVASGTYKIEAGRYIYWKFNCKEGDRLSGYISVPEYDINVWLIQGDREFEAFKRGETFYYLSNVSAEKTSYHSIDCRLEEGTYYIILDNKYSWFNSKSPTIQLQLISD
jgi:DNA-directed RNA polymerase subunit M/transcription elongation factor TFIIS